MKCKSGYPGHSPERPIKIQEVIHIMREVYVVNCCRTAIGSFGGSLKDTPAAELGATVIKEALNRAGVKPENVDEVMFGCILTAGLGQNVARQASLKAGIPTSVPAYTCLLYTSPSPRD